LLHEKATSLVRTGGVMVYYPCAQGHLSQLAATLAV